MSCPPFETLSAYADKECLASEREALAAHLPACPACARTLRGIAAERRALAALAVPAAPADLEESLLALAPRTGRWGALLAELRAGLFQPSGAIAAAALAAAALMLWTRQEPAPVVAELEVPVEVLMAAHQRYALSMPLAPPETAPPPAQLQLAGAAGERDVY